MLVLNAEELQKVFLHLLHFLLHPDLFRCLAVCDLFFLQSMYCIGGGRYALTKAFLVAFVLTFFSIFDVPVFWPILLLYWIVLFVLTMKRQIRHMIKYRYVPFSLGKQRYTGKRPAQADKASTSKD
jgi:hypothetical protein